MERVFEEVTELWRKISGHERIIALYNMYGPLEMLHLLNTFRLNNRTVLVFSEQNPVSEGLLEFEDRFHVVFEKPGTGEEPDRFSLFEGPCEFEYRFFLRAGDGDNKVECLYYTRLLSRTASSHVSSRQAGKRLCKGIICYNPFFFETTGKKEGSLLSMSEEIYRFLHGTDRFEYSPGDYFQFGYPLSDINARASYEFIKMDLENFLKAAGEKI